MMIFMVYGTPQFPGLAFGALIYRHGPFPILVSLPAWDPVWVRVSSRFPGTNDLAFEPFFAKQVVLFSKVKPRKIANFFDISDLLEYIYICAMCVYIYIYTVLV